MILDVVTLAASLAAAVLAALALFRKSGITQSQLDTALSSRVDDALREQLRQFSEELRRVRAEVTESVNGAMKLASETQSAAYRQVADVQNVRLRELTDQLTQRQMALQRTVAEQFAQFERRMQTGSVENEQKLENIRATMENRLTAMQAENGRRLEEMRVTVDEKLQKTLDDKLRQSFSLVSERLEMVYKGLGEMQTLAAGVGDLKKVLGNVKTRGILGEIQLGAILEQILSPEQYAANVATVKGSSERVEYAVRLPGDGGEPVWLPIDAKFPADAYAALLDAYDAADAAQVEAAAKVLEQRVRGFAKDIHDKYIHVPETTEFGIMFVPVEGMYAELVRRGMVEKLQAEFKIVLAGPTTMAALLNSLQMGFRTLAIQKRSGEVWAVLGSVKSEFDTFGKALEQTQRRIEQAGSELEKLVGVRTRQIQRRLRSVTALPESGAGEESAAFDEETL